MLHLLRSLMRHNRGSAAIEFALVAPLMAIIMIGMYQGAQIERADTMVSNSAAAIADLVAQQVNGVTGGTSGSLGKFCSAAKLMMTTFPTTGTAGTAGAYSVAIASVTNYTAGGVKIDWESDGSCSVTATALGSAASSIVTSPTNLIPTAGSPYGDSAIVVHVTYIYSSIIQYILPGLFTLTQDAFARPRGNAPISCPSPCT
jgi:Flp pilus assembly protein TadG